MAGPSKTCTKCGEHKPAEDFHRRSSARDGRHAQCKPCLLAYHAVYYADPAVRARDAANARARGYSPRRRKHSVLRALYGIGLDDYDRMLCGQHGRCAICGDALDGGKRTHVDHDHCTGAVRALLCKDCNTGIGHLRDDPSLLRCAADYLEAHTT